MSGRYRFKRGGNVHSMSGKQTFFLGDVHLCLTIEYPKLTIFQTQTIICGKG